VVVAFVVVVVALVVVVVVLVVALVVVVVVFVVASVVVPSVVSHQQLGLPFPAHLQNFVVVAPLLPLSVSNISCE